MTIEEALQVPLKSLNGQNIQAKFEEIAKNLFNYFCIKCGEKTFYFAEIEFYYYKKGVFEHDKDIAYKRKGYKAGDLFYHLSGVDICFKSDDDSEYGGILVRSLMEEIPEKTTNAICRKVVTGPMNCLITMLNACQKQDYVPQLEELKYVRKIEPKSTYRYFGDEDRKKILNGLDNKDAEKKLAYYDPTIKQDEWDSVNEAGKKKYYYTHRFKYE